MERPLILRRCRPVKRSAGTAARSGRPDSVAREGNGVKRAPEEPGLQKKYAPRGRCFGCGPANRKGLRLESHVRGGEVIAAFAPQPHHEAFDGVVSGGIIGTLLDCHSNWTAAYHLMHRSGTDRPPCTVTAEYSVKLLRPTPSSGPLTLRARPVEIGPDRATVEATLQADGTVCAT